jgi:ubiquinone/menaquinone biosynthesis C-methylase UbiE
MNELHEANRRGWDAISARWQSRIGEKGVWRRCHRHPELVFSHHELAWLQEVSGKRVAVLGSGDNLVVFALAGLGANVTSVDISQEQLNCGISRASELGLNVDFIRSDVTDLSELPDNSFDIVYTGGHVAVWVSDIFKYYHEAGRILRPGGLFIVAEYHPFRRIFRAEGEAFLIESPYLNRGPFAYDRAEENSLDITLSAPLPSYEFHWTVSDFINAVVKSGCEIFDCREYGDKVEPWEDLPSCDLPETLLIASRKLPRT